MLTCGKSFLDDRRHLARKEAAVGISFLNWDKREEEGFDRQKSGEEVNKDFLLEFVDTDRCELSKIEVDEIENATTITEFHEIFVEKRKEVVETKTNVMDFRGKGKYSFVDVKEELFKIFRKYEIFLDKNALKEDF